MAPRRGARKATQPTVQAEAAVADSAIDAAASNGNANKAEKATKATKSAPAAKENAKKAAASKKKGAAEQIEQHQPENGGGVENDVVEEVSAKVNAKSKVAGTTKKNAKATEQPTNGNATNGNAPDDGKKRAAKGKQPKVDEEVEPPVKKAKAAKGKAKKADQEAVVDIPDEPEPEPAPGPSKVVDKKKGKSAKKIVEPAEVEEEEEEAVVPVEVKGRRGAKKPVVPEKPAEIAKPVKGKAKKAETTKTSAKAAKAKQNADEPADQIDDDDVEEKVAPTVAKGRKRGAASAVVVEKSPAKKDKKETSAATATAAAAAKTKANGKSSKRKAGVKAAADSTTDEPDGGLVTKRKKGAKDDANANAEAESKMNPTESDLSQIDFGTDKDFTLKVVSWNVAGLRALVTKNGMDYFEHEKPDIICLQEIKCLEEEVPEAAKLHGYHPYWCSTPGGRGGVAILSKQMPREVEVNLKDEEMDEEGRIITAEYTKFYLVCVYVPNAGRKLVNLERRLRWNKLFEAHVTALKAKKPVIICGDMNVAHEEIDLTNPKTNKKNAGFSDEEREGMTNLLSLGFIDTFRDLYPNKDKAYTFWSYMGGNRGKNIGWRLDYSIISDNLKNKVVDSFMRPQILGSDHCPIVLLLNI